MGKNKVSVNHRAYSLYQKSLEDLRKTAEDDHFTHAVRTVAVQLKISLTEAKEAIYKGHAERNELSYEESKALIKAGRDFTSSTWFDDFEEYYLNNRINLDELEKEYEQRDNSDLRSKSSWLNDRVSEEVERLRVEHENLDRATVID